MARPKPELVAVPEGLADGRAWLRAETERARQDGRKLVVYVGAVWCEPCTRFHEALARGELDHQLAGVRFVDFDHDRHEELLRQTGCRSKLVPLFALSTPDGTCSEVRAEGAVKGDGAVGFILPRLRAMLGG